MIVYPIATLYLSLLLYVFYMAWNREYEFQVILSRIDRSVDCRYFEWIILVGTMLTGFTMGSVYFWFKS